MLKFLHNSTHINDESLHTPKAAGLLSFPCNLCEYELRPAYYVPPQCEARSQIISPLSQAFRPLPE